MALRGKKLAIDIGTEHTRIALQRKDVVLDQPTVLAHDEVSNNWAIGDDAIDMSGRSPEDVSVIWPVRSGVIADYSAAMRLLKHFVRETTGRLQINKPEALVAMSASATSTERRALIDATREAGTQEVFLIHAAMAASIGAGLPIQKPRGSMVVNIGAGTTEVGIFSLGGTVTERAQRVGGQSFDDAIARYLRSKHSLLLGREELHRVKHEFIDLSADGMKSTTVHGQNILQNVPRSATIKMSEVSPYIDTVIDAMVLNIKRVLEHTPPDIISDLIKHGITLTGGGAQLNGLPEYLSKKLRVACILAEEPEAAVIRGTQQALQHIEDYRRSLVQ